MTANERILCHALTATLTALNGYYMPEVLKARFKQEILIAQEAIEQVKGAA